MIISFLYIVLAILALTFLIFIHELGHYWMAKRVGMRVEIFSIGFGRPIYSWERDGVKWQIGWLLCGGYVKIAGMETSSKSDPYEVAGGFFTKSPLDRIKVLFMGPFVNVVFAFVAFALLWGMGGRVKSYTEFTRKIGWVDPQSELYVQGVRPGDEIVTYDSHQYQNVGDHLYAPMTAGDKLNVKGFHINYVTKDKTPYAYTVKTYPHPAALDKGILTGGVLNSANYIIYDRFSGGTENPLVEGSPLEGSGIEYGDRIAWVDGELIFSLRQLHRLINDEQALLTVRRNHETFLKRVPRIKVEELKLPTDFKEELIDWQYEAHLNKTRFPKLYTIPYTLDNQRIVENRVKFIDPEIEKNAFPKHPFAKLDEPLSPGDQIIAVDTARVDSPYQLLDRLQQKRVSIIVERDPEAISKISWSTADANFDEQLKGREIQKISNSLGTGSTVKEAGDFYFLHPVTPKKYQDFALSLEAKALRKKELAEKRKAIEAIDDPERRARQLLVLEEQENQKLIGLPGIQDRKVDYNPNPFVLFKDVFSQIWRMLGALVTGSISPKWLSGPVGIVHAVQEQSMSSIKEMIFWLGAISLNLGVLNLLPIPPFDGGGIVIAFSEMVSGRRLRPKTMEKLVYPFAILLIAFFLFITYHDVTRIFGRFLKW